MNIILIGFMGTGKSVIGKLLAAHLEFDFLDTDILIEERTRMRIPEMFAGPGESYFRSLEAEIAQELLNLDRRVVATGGGFALNPENMKAIRQSGVVIALSAPPAEILARIKDDGQRPLLQTPDPLARILELLEKRAPVYGQADFTIDTSGKTKENIVAEIESELIRRRVLDGRS